MVSIMGAWSQGINNRTIYYVEPNQLDPRTLRVKASGIQHESTYDCSFL